MTKYGSAFSATDNLKKAPGQSHDAGLRQFCNYFDLAVDGGTTETLLIAELPPGVVYDSCKLTSGANLSTINFTIGDGTTANRFGASTAGPNAGTVTIEGAITLKLDPLTAKTQVFLTPSLALPSAGALRTKVYASKR